MRSRLLQRAHRDGEEFQRLLVRFGIERFLYRLSLSSHADRFVLKGATLFSLWLDAPHRATKDLDLLGHGSPDVDHLVTVFSEVARIECAEDGMEFDPAAITGARIRTDAAYAGVRCVIPASLAGARIPISVDVGLGDVMVPDPQTVSVPSLLNLPEPRLRAYAPETVVAEKLEALVVLGMATSRMKDLFDLDLIRETFEFDDGLVDAIRATFDRRGTALPDQIPIGLTDAFSDDATKQTQWRAFVRKAAPESRRDLGDVVRAARSWLWPAMQRARRDSE